ncbi:PREDICTED: UDP-glycosyltransferase 74E2 [Tarenaya hassleriana]|uniref:UDP-glycosyltransferase 74E2 n=1 Tax=Tarenaya hassleriana TaxID=28532 RepID=UPI00053C397E|nr:PREDICTED: UDP-glycosyltransferase 74E2 [Tarenaya hassleriana]
MEGAHVLALPYPAQGHITPMLQLCKRLASKSVKVTLVIVSDKPSKPYRTQHDITVVTIWNGFREGEEPLRDLDEYMDRVERSISNHLPLLIDELKSSEFPPKSLVYDSSIPWVLDIAKSNGLYGAVLFTQPWFVTVVYYHVRKGSFCVPSRRDDHPTLASFPSLPLLSPSDLPSFLCESGSYPSLLEVVLNQLSNIEKADLVLCNTFDKLEEKVMKWMEENLWPVKNIGPTVPSLYLDKRLPGDKDYGLSLFNPKVDECLTWLDTKEPNSVVYVSFGSLVVLKDEHMHELAAGLKQTGHSFLWVVRETETDKLPRNYLQEVSEKGLVVTWSPQLQVLAHKSVGCFVTHCGWNSTLEAMSLGVPMIGMPHWTDQPTNAKFIEDVWKVGVRVKADRDGFVRREEIERCVGEIMEGVKGQEIRRSVDKWKDFAREAVSEGGSSDRNIDVLVDKFCQMK